MHQQEDHIVYFISDLHLSSSRPNLCAAFFNFLQTISKDATDLFILGDFFNFWVGDDLSSPLSKQVSEALSTLAQNGVQIYFQHGNRDFAIGENYAKTCGMTILPEIYSLPFAPEIIILHGDQLCLADIKYQRYRRIIRHPLVLKILRALPKKWRLNIANRLRESSKNRQPCTTQYTTNFDVTQDAVETTLAQYAAKIMIHGHTHKPDYHQHTNGERWVLSDWEATADYLKWDQQHGLVRHTFTIPSV